MSKIDELRLEINDLKKEVYFFKKSINDRINVIEKNSN